MKNRNSKCLKSIWQKTAISFVALALLIVIMPLTASAANVTTGTIGDNGGITWTYDGDTDTLTLTGEDSDNWGDGGEYNGQNVSVLKKRFPNAKKIIVDDLKIVGDASSFFSGLSSLENIEFKKIDTSNVTNMRFMFTGCQSLENLDLTSFNTSKVEDMGWMFASCNGLTSLNVSSFDTSQVTGMYGMFNGCSNLTTLDVSGFDTSKVTSFHGMHAMFSGCNSLTSLDVSNFDTSNVTNMSYMFGGCNSLTSLDVSNFDTSNVTDMREMFSGCQELENLDVSNFDTSKVKNMRGMFYFCFKIKALDVSNFNTSSVEDMGYMFFQCIKVTELDVSNFDTSNVTNMSGMFAGPQLSVLDVSNFDTSKVTDMSSMFAGNNKLTSLDVSNFNTSNVTNMKMMFRYSPNLTTLDLSSFDTSKVTDMSLMFEENSKLSDINLSGFDLSNIAENGTANMFRACRKLKTIQTPKVIPEGMEIALADVYLDEAGNKHSALSSAVCATTLTQEPNPFSDVQESGWQYAYVKFALNNNLMKGKDTDAEGNIVFDPDKEMTRAEFVQTLYNKEGKPAVTYTDKFPDVEDGKWYTNAILWAAENNIVAGKGNGNFDVSGNITRQEMATILYKYANYKQYNTVGRSILDNYTDASSVSSWAVENMKWALSYGVMKGKGDRLAPLENATRAECATMLCNFMSYYEGY